MDYEGISQEMAILKENEPPKGSYNNPFRSLHAALASISGDLKGEFVIDFFDSLRVHTINPQPQKAINLYVSNFGA